MKSLFKKIAVLGFTGVMLSVTPGLSSASDFNDTPEVIAAMAAVNSHVEFMENFGFTNALKYTLTFDVSYGDHDGQNMANVFNESHCDVTVGLNKKGANSMSSKEYRDELDVALNYSDDDRLMLAKAFAGHEVAHCRLVKIKNPFAIGTEDENKLVNYVYGNTLTRGVIEKDGKHVVNFGLGDFLNEAYADGMAFALMIKSEAQDKVSSFFKKVSANRDLQTLKVTEDGIMSNQQIDAYDLKNATHGLNNKSTIKLILDSKTPEELDRIVLNNANDTVLSSLSKRSANDLKGSIGVEAIYNQAVNYSVLSSSHLDENSLVAQAIDHAKNNLTSENKEKLENSLAIMSSTNFSKMNEAIKNLKILQEVMKPSLKSFIVEKEPEINKAIEVLHKNSHAYKETNITLNQAIIKYHHEFNSTGINFVTNRNNKNNLSKKI